MRASCLLCVLKHLGSAHVLFREARTGYSSHRWLAIGEMEQASQESEADYPDLSSAIYSERKMCEDQEYNPDVMSLIQEAEELLNKNQSQE